MNRMTVTLAALLLGMLAGCAGERSPGPAAQPAVDMAVAEAQPVIPGDLLHVRVSGVFAALIDKPVRVDTAGRISLPAYGVVTVGGVSLAQAEQRIYDGYAAAALTPPGRVAIDREESGRRPSVKPGPIRPGGCASL